MINFRKDFIVKIKKLLESNSAIHCVWEGGSAATGYLDQYSDLDLGIICDDKKVEDTFEKIEKYLQKNYGIKENFRTPEPSWHGHSQCYYLLDKTPEYFYVDILIEKLSAGNRFMEIDRHGHSIVWFDHKRLFDSTPTQEKELAQKGKRFYKLINDSTWILILDVKKQILRKNTVDAFVLYYQLVNRMAYLWNLKYCPAKSDFGLRYTHRDFPEETIIWLEDKLIVKNLAEMQKKLEIIDQKYSELLAELKAKWRE
ncbi:MAG: nucleotidyltransferase domain-containing protein [Candidatus Cloacimonadales bacterium]|nr:nucleotidyltransferase domain-containing protein [Candidatus Cloacimonadales bacterium]